MICWKIGKAVKEQFPEGVSVIKLRRAIRENLHVTTKKNIFSYMDFLIKEQFIILDVGTYRYVGNPDIDKLMPK